MAKATAAESTAPVTKEPEVRMVKIKLPRTRKDGKGLYVNVNNHQFWIPRGEAVEVPWYIAEVIENSAAQDENTAALIDSLTQGSNF